MKGRALPGLRGDARTVQYFLGDGSSRRHQAVVEGSTYERLRGFAAEHGYSMSEAARVLIRRGLEA